MARRFGVTKFADLLANSLAQDETTLAIAESLDSVLLKSAQGLAELLIYARLALAGPDSLVPPMQRLTGLAGGLSPIPEPLLDLLAWQSHVDGYEAAVTCEDKRRLVDRSILMHRRKGTPWAVAEALRAIGYADARIYEGGGICRYDGEIAYDGRETYAAGNRWALFDVEIDLGDDMGVSAASVLRLRAAIEAWKNARSHLRALRWRATISDSLDFDELLEWLTVRPSFTDIRPWGFPCHDGSINHGNAIFRRHDGRLQYGGGHPHNGWEACGHLHNNQIERFFIGASMRFASLARPCLKYDAFLPHNGQGTYGQTDSPALDKNLITIIARPQVENVSARDESETSVQPHSLDWMYRCHNGSFAYGPHVMDGSFLYDGSRLHDSGAQFLHSGHHFHNGVLVHDCWLRNGPLYNSGPHESLNARGNLAALDIVRHTPVFSGQFEHDGEYVHGPLDAAAADSCKAAVAARILDDLKPGEKTENTLAAALFDESGSVVHNGSISHGQKRISVYGGVISHDGFFRHDLFGGAPDFRAVSHDGAANFSGHASHSPYGWQSEPHAPVYFYRNLSEFCLAGAGVEFADEMELDMLDDTSISVAPRIVEDMRPLEIAGTHVKAASTDWIGHSHDGAITYGQRRIGVHAGGSVHDGSLLSGPYGGMADFAPLTASGGSKYDGLACHSFWGRTAPAYSYRALADVCAARAGMDLAEKFFLADGLNISVKRHVMHNGKSSHDASKNHSYKEFV